MTPTTHPLSRVCAVALANVLAASPCLGHGGYHEEIQRSDQQLAADPENAELWFHRGRLDHLHGDWMKALLDLDAAERLAPGKYPVDLARGQAWMAGEKLPQARRALDAFIASHPEVAEGFSTRARLMMKAGDPKTAAGDFKQALAKTASPEPDLYIGFADALVASKQPEQAVRELDAGLKKLGAIPSLADKALEIELSLGSFDAALTRVADMRGSAPRAEPWMAKRASILAQAGRIDESRTAWLDLRDHLLALPENERGSHAMGVLLEEARNSLESLSHSSPAATSNPTKS